MVKDVRREEIEAAEPGAFQSYKSQLGEGMSIIFSKATAFGIGYYMSRTVVSTRTATCPPFVYFHFYSPHLHLSGCSSPFWRLSWTSSSSHAAPCVFDP